MGIGDHLKRQLSEGLKEAGRGLAGGLQGKSYAQVEQERREAEAEQRMFAALEEGQAKARRAVQHEFGQGWHVQQRTDDWVLA